MSCLNFVIPSEDIALHSNEMFKAPHSETKFAQIYLIPSEIPTRTEWSKFWNLKLLAG